MCSKGNVLLHAVRRRSLCGNRFFIWSSNILLLLLSSAGHDFFDFFDFSFFFCFLNSFAALLSAGLAVDRGTAGCDRWCGGVILFATQPIALVVGFQFYGRLYAQPIQNILFLLLISMDLTKTRHQAHDT